MRCRAEYDSRARVTCIAGSAPSFAQRYSGFFLAAIPGEYVFRLTSDDGSLLWLDGNAMPLINNTDPTCASVFNLLTEVNVTPPLWSEPVCSVPTPRLDVPVRRVWCATRAAV